MADIFLNFPTTVTIAVAVVAFVLGAVFGSFINCVAWRLVAGESPWTGRSHCDNCGHALGVLDLVPVFSYLLGGGRCRYCKQHFSSRCLVTELLLGVLFVVIVLHFGMSLPAVCYAALACVMLGLSLVDIDTKTIPNGFHVAGIVIWVILIAGSAAIEGSGDGALSQLFGGSPVCAFPNLFEGLLGAGWLSWAACGLLGGVVIAGAVLLFSLLFDIVLGRQSMGGGDIKLLFVTGLFLGLPQAFFNLILSCVIGIVMGIAYNSRAGLDEEGHSRAFPFGPAIAAACVITLFVGEPFVGWYLGFLM